MLGQLGSSPSGIYGFSCVCDYCGDWLMGSVFFVCTHVPYQLNYSLGTIVVIG